ncbi:MAG: hypothetical protein SFT94_05585 [Pseudanabaenaceae cyanobacterium bins.68]|nr:hypothetical protein [Pseudanabaenaceae cyanobacterium bins.68]
MFQFDRYETPLFEAIFAPLLDAGFTDNFKAFNVDSLQPRNDRDANDPRAFLYNLLDTVFTNLNTLNPRLGGLQITRTYSTVNGLPRVVFGVTFNFSDIRNRVLITDPALDALVPPIEPPV